MLVWLHHSALARPPVQPLVLASPSPRARSSVKTYHTRMCFPVNTAQAAELAHHCTIMLWVYIQGGEPELKYRRLVAMGDIAKGR